MDSAADVEHLADETVIVRTPQQFIAVGAWYRDFDQLEDAEVRALLEQAAARLPEEWRHAVHRHTHSS
jgi:predicted phosphoribosyltransferase